MILALLLSVAMDCQAFYELRIYAPNYETAGLGIAFDADRALIEEERTRVLAEGWDLPHLPSDDPEDEKHLEARGIFRTDITKWCCPGFPYPCYRPRQGPQ